MKQQALFDDIPCACYLRPKGQLLKWIGSKYKMAEVITSHFPRRFGRFFDVFLGSGSILATLAPQDGVGGDCFGPLVGIWQKLKDAPDTLVQWYEERYNFFMSGDRVANYEKIKASYNANPNSADFLFLTRSCYGGVVRFRRDGYMSTPIGVHVPISPARFAERVAEWRKRVEGCSFLHSDYRNVTRLAEKGDLIYCDPPYSFSQSILYGAQSFSFQDLIDEIRLCKLRGIYVALSIDGAKRSGRLVCQLPIPEGIFEREIQIRAGRSMLKRFQMEGGSVEEHEVSDRLLLTY